MCGYDCAGRYPHRLPFTSMVWAFLLVPSRLLSMQKNDAHQKSDWTILKRQGSVSPALVFTLQSGASGVGIRFLLPAFGLLLLYAAIDKRRQAKYVPEQSRQVLGATFVEGEISAEEADTQQE